MMFGKYILCVDIKTFDKKIEKYPWLQDFRELFVELKTSYSKIPDVPYLHELVDEKNLKIERKIEL